MKRLNSIRFAKIRRCQGILNQAVQDIAKVLRGDDRHPQTGAA